jgi:hypothetical protein
MMKKIIIFLAIALCFSASAITVKAVSPTPEATDAAVQEIRDKVKEIVREKLDETQKGQKKAFVGTISEINGLNLTLETNEGNRQLNIATDAALINKVGKKITMKDLKTGLFAIAMGFMEENDVLGVRRLVISEKPKTVAKEIAFGKVTDISKEENAITIKNEKKNIIYTVEVTDKTTITKKVDGKVQKVKLEVIETGDYLIAIGAPTENEHKIVTAKIIHVIPGLSKEASPTPSAKPSVKATPTPKSTPTPTP